MAKAKQTRRMIAMALAAAVTISSVPVVAFAETGESGGTPSAVSTDSGSGEGGSGEGGSGEGGSGEGGSGTTTTNNPDGSVTQSTTTESSTENGGTQTTTESVTTSGDADAATGEAGDNGTIEFKTEVTVKDADGNVVENFTVTEGTETETTETPDSGDESGQPPVTVPLTPGETTGEAITNTEITGDVPTGEDDPEYDYTETTEIDRTVTAETSEVTTEIIETEAELESVKPVYNPTKTDELYSDSGHFGITDGTAWKAIMNELVRMKTDGEITEEQYNALVTSKDGSDYVDGTIKYNKDGSVADAKRNDAKNFYEMMEDPIMLKAIQKVLGDELTAEDSDADYRFIGSGNYSSQWVSKVYVTYAKDEVTGEPLVDENGDYIVESITKSDGTEITVGGVSVTELTPEYIESLGGDLSGVYDQKTGTRASQFMLMDKDGNIIFTHCIDIETGATKGKWYKIANLEDNDYYASEEAEDHVRSIVMNGYWGTSDEMKEDGTYETGSMAKVKNDLLAAIANGDISDTVTISYKQDGQIVTEEIKVTAELLDGFTPGEATDVMQAAIWSYANGAQGIEDGRDGWSVGGAYYGDTANGQSNNHAALVNDPAGMARMKLFYDWLINLDTDEESTTVINEKTFGETSLTIGDKISSSDDGNSDTYEASLSFKAEFEVGENDELYVNLTYKDLEGNEQLVRKQLGRAGEEGSDDVIVPDADNSYTLANLALTENEDFTFDLRLEGVQQLKQNAYIFVSEGGVNDSQTFVGMAEGTNTVDISTSVTVKFDVDEDDVVKKVRKWRDDGRIKFEGGNGGSNDPVGPTPDPENPTPEEPVEIGEDEVPLSDAPVVESEEVMEIGDSDVPLAEMVLGAEEEAPLVAGIPDTGDNNHVMGFGAMALAALAGMFGLRKKEN